VLEPQPELTADPNSQHSFQRRCVVCGEFVPLDRLKRGADTCCPEHKRQDRIAQRRFQKQLADEKLIARGWVKVPRKRAERSAPRQVCELSEMTFGQLEVVV
jgi:hypothetical protein